MPGGAAARAPFGARAGQGGSGGGAATLAALYALATSANDNAVTLDDTRGGISFDGSALASADPFSVRANDVGSLRQTFLVQRTGEVFMGASSGAPSASAQLHIVKGNAFAGAVTETVRIDRRASSGTPAANDGQRWSYYVANAAGTVTRAVSMDAYWTTATAASEAAKYVVNVIGSGSFAAAGSEPLQVTKTLVQFGASAAADVTNGRFGAGTTSPGFGVHVANTDTVQAVFKKTDGNARIELRDSSDTVAALRMGTGGNFNFEIAGNSMAFYTASQAQVPFFCDGNPTNTAIGFGNVSPSSKLIVGGNLANQASGASAVLDYVDIKGITVTVTGGTNITTAAGYNYFTVRKPTYTDSTAVQVSHAATLYVEGAPVADGSLTFASGGINGNKALWVDDGMSRFDGDTYCGAASTSAAYLAGSSGSLQFFGTTGAVSKQTVTGSRGGNAALASLLTALANYGLVTDSSTA